MNDRFSVEISELAAGSPFCAAGELQSIELNPGYGSGRLAEIITLQTGIYIIIQNYSLYRDWIIRLHFEEAFPSLIEFFTCLSGIDYISYAKNKVPMKSGDSNVYISDCEPALFMKVNNENPVRSISICIDPHIFEKLTGKNTTDLARLLDIPKSGVRGKNNRLESLDFAQRICGHQVFTSFMNNPDDRLFLEAKALELIALQLRQLEHMMGEKPQKAIIDDTVVKISRACEILKREMANPPKKLELARRVGLNHKQLIKGFKEIVGVCPFEYLRALRLEKAYCLIIRHECNITEAAYSVGYSSLSHFTKTFRRKFGINPKALAKKA